MRIKRAKRSQGSSATPCLKSDRHQSRISQFADTANKTLHALTSAAIVLPGLMLSSAQAADGDRINFQFSRYQEGKRNLFGTPNNFDPIRVDTLYGNGSFSLTDRAKFSFSYAQDTWSGATPITTSPLAANPYQSILANTVRHDRGRRITVDISQGIAAGS